ncbi:MAG: hypothetical protein ACRERD_04340 [Candidatus Binatia bacterium]
MRIRRTAAAFTSTGQMLRPYGGLAAECLGVIVITVGIVLLHRRVERQIQELRGLSLWKPSLLSFSLLCHSCSSAWLWMPLGIRSKLSY